MKKGFFNNRLFNSGMKNTTHFSEDDKHLKKRIENIMDDGKKSRGLILLAVVLALCLLCGSVIGFTAGKKENKNPAESDIGKESTEEKGNHVTEPTQKETFKAYPDENRIDYIDQYEGEFFVSDQMAAGFEENHLIKLRVGEGTANISFTFPEEYHGQNRAGWELHSLEYGGFDFEFENPIYIGGNYMFRLFEADNAFVFEQISNYNFTQGWILHDGKVTMLSYDPKDTAPENVNLVFTSSDIFSYSLSLYKGKDGRLMYRKIDSVMTNPQYTMWYEGFLISRDQFWKEEGIASFDGGNLSFKNGEVYTVSQKTFDGSFTLDEWFESLETPFETIDEFFSENKRIMDAYDTWFYKSMIASGNIDWSIFTSPIDTELADEEQLNRLFYRAFTAGALFTGYSYKYPTYCEGDTIMYKNGENTAQYAPTNIFGAETLSALREVLDGIFTSDVANALMNTQTYKNFLLHIEQDGKLYRFGGFAAVESIEGAPKFDIKNIDQGSAEFTVYIYGDTVFTARAEKADGVWKMSKFDFPYAEYAQRNFKY